VERLYLPVMGGEVALQRLKARYCTGHYDLLTLANAPCPAFAKLEDSRQDQCADCFRRSGFNPAFYNVSQEQLSPQQRSYNDEPHDIYVAWFGQALLKVGISNRRRTLQRLLEQGALRASVVARVPSAYDARAHERRIRDRLGMPESIPQKAKVEALRGWAGAPDELPEMEGALRAVEALRLEGAAPPFIENLERWYTGGSPLPPISLTLVDISAAKPLVAAGRPMGLVGSLLLFSNAQVGEVGCSLRPFLGHVARFESALLSIPEGARQARLI
jgi:hypothetical protein